jgi:hypothetical protein
MNSLMIPFLDNFSRGFKIMILFSEFLVWEIG